MCDSTYIHCTAWRGDLTVPFLLEWGGGTTKTTKSVSRRFSCENAVLSSFAHAPTRIDMVDSASVNMRHTAAVLLLIEMVKSIAHPLPVK